MRAAVGAGAEGTGAEGRGSVCCAAKVEAKLLAIQQATKDNERPADMRAIVVEKFVRGKDVPSGKT